MWMFLLGHSVHRHLWCVCAESSCWHEIRDPVCDLRAQAARPCSEESAQDEHADWLTVWDEHADRLTLCCRCCWQCLTDKEPAIIWSHRTFIIYSTSLCWASQHNAARSRSSGACSYRLISAARARAQQQTRRTSLLLSIDGTDRWTDGRTDTRQMHRLCTAYYAGKLSDLVGCSVCNVANQCTAGRDADAREQLTLRVTESILHSFISPQNGSKNRIQIGLN